MKGRVTWDDIHAKQKEIEVAKQFFNNCDPELFEMANLKLMALEMELAVMQKDMRAGLTGKDTYSIIVSDP